MQQRVTAWMDCWVSCLSSFANTQPNTSYSAFTHRFKTTIFAPIQVSQPCLLHLNQLCVIIYFQSWFPMLLLTLNVSYFSFSDVLYSWDSQCYAGFWATIWFSSRHFCKALLIWPYPRDLVIRMTSYTIFLPSENSLCLPSCNQPSLIVLHFCVGLLRVVWRRMPLPGCLHFH